MDLQTLKKLAGVDADPGSMGENISITGTEKAEYQRKHNIKSGSPEWFKLWLSLIHI